MTRPPFSHYTEDGRPKRLYPSRPAAKSAARRFFSMFSTKLWPYPCDECPGWHLSSTPRRPPIEEDPQP